MDYKKLKKDELVALLEKNEKVVAQAEFHKKEFEAAKKLKDEAVKESYTYKKELDKLKKSHEQLEAEQKLYNESIKVLEEKHKNELDALKKLKTEAQGNEHEQKIEIERLKLTLDSQQKETEKMIEKFNEDYKSVQENYNQIASILEDYIQTLDDQHLLYGVMQRNSKNTIQLLKGKIKNLTEGDK
jgi:predicted secreted protein